MTLFATQMKKTTRQKKLVFGLGMTGYSCVSYLVKQGYEVLVFDTRQAPPCLEKIYCEFPQVEVLLVEFDLNLLQDINQIIASPGVSLSLPALSEAKQQGIEIVGDVQLFADQAQAPIIAITGSNGKTTTASLVAEMLENAGKKVGLGGNIGVPVLDLLEQNTPDFYVLELSSFQLETTPNLKASIAVILNISEDHMDRYDSLEQYAQSKLAIYQHADYKLINIDDNWLNRYVSENKNTLSFTSGEPKKDQYGLRLHQNEQWICVGEDAIFPASQLKLKGRHQLMNAIVAVAIGELCQLPREAMCQTLREFDGLAHRMQFVETINGVNYVNDSKGTNLGATLAAVAGIDEPIILIAGGESKGADFSEFGQGLIGHVKQVILIGQDAGLIEQKIGDLLPVIRAMSLQAAVELAAKIAKSDECVLLSPACASFDMFENYQHRGDEFIKAVRSLR